MFGREKKKNSNESADAIESVNSLATAKAKKSGMKTVLKESVVDTIVEDFQNNEPFVYEYEGNKRYVGLVLSAEDIGGLDKKSKKDEAKGTIVELINGGRIKAYCEPNMIEQDKLIIIPDEDTLSLMSEFSLLTGVDYGLCLVSEDGSVEETEFAMSFDEAESVLLGKEDVAAFIEEDGDGVGFDEGETKGETETEDEDLIEDDDENIADEILGPEEDEVIEDEEDKEWVTDEVPVISEDMAIEDAAEEEPEPEPEEAVASSIEEEGDVDFEDLVAEDVDAQDDIEFINEDDAEDIETIDLEEPEEEVVYEIPSEVVNETIRRKFYSDGLGLEVSTEPFDTQFLHNSTFVPFDDKRPEGWLNNYINAMAHDANIDLARVHSENLFRLRERYLKLISMHCEKIQRDLDVNEPGTQYNELYTAIQNGKMAEEETIQKDVALRKDEINKEWDATLDRVGSEAAANARRVHEDRYGASHRDELYRVEFQLKDAIEDNYQNSLNELYTQRRNEASKRLDLGITETLQECSDMYEKMLDDENALRKEYADKITAFIDENRINEVVRSKALADELAQIEKADKVTAEYKEKIQALSKEYTAHKQVLQADVDKFKRDNEETLKQKELQFTQRLEENNNRYNELQNRYDELSKQYLQLDDSKKREYESRINELINERESWQDRCDVIVQQHKKAQGLSLFLAIIALVAALLIGFISGEYVHANRSAAAGQNKIVERYEQQISDLESKLTETTETDGN